MKKIIILMRHAEAEDSNDKGDIFRNLTATGIKQAKEAAKYLTNFKIDKILVSPSTRTQQTLDIINQDLKIADTEIVDEIYNSSVENILEIIKAQDSHLSSILILGHNPNIYSLAVHLANPENQTYSKLSSFSMELANIIKIDIEQANFEWRDIIHKGEVADIYSPNKN